ncbi:MAG: helix-turn-helix transcriptional regulator [Clostridia bacterium]|nr:helix-turn-helix transcriptional regulator [Clostridia bacterium]
MMKPYKASNEIRIFFSNLIYLRRRHGYTQKQMANLLGIGIPSWRMIEQGILSPRLSTKVILRAEEKFGIPAYRLLSEKFEK